MTAQVGCVIGGRSKPKTNQHHEANASIHCRLRKPPTGPCETSTEAVLTPNGLQFSVHVGGTLQRFGFAKRGLPSGKLLFFPGDQPRIPGKRRTQVSLRRVTSLWRRHFGVCLVDGWADRSPLQLDGIVFVRCFWRAGTISMSIPISRQEFRRPTAATKGETEFARERRFCHAQVTFE